MRYAAVFLIVALFVVIGCEFQAPLTEEHIIPVDQSVLGLWEEVPDDGKPPNPNERILILKYTDTEYLILYPAEKDGLFFRGYPIKVEGITCVQTQFIGSIDGDISKEERKYHVISYKLTNDILELKTLNSKLIDKNLKDSTSLKRAFRKYKDDKDLFVNPGKFRRIKAKN